MDKIVYNFLTELDNQVPLNFGGLIEFINENNIIIKNSGIRGAPALVIDEIIYIDVYQLKLKSNLKEIYFILLHEISHHLRFKKLGNGYAKSTFEIEDFNLFIETIIYEEEFADRLAHLLYYQLNGETINYYHYRAPNYQYERNLKPFFEAIKQGANYNSILTNVLFERDEEILNPIS